MNSIEIRNLQKNYKNFSLTILINKVKNLLGL